MSTHGLRIIIDHGQTRRVIKGAFEIIGDAYVLRDVANQILQQVGEHDEPPFVFGSVYICEKHRGVPNMAPKMWDE